MARNRRRVEGEVTYSWLAAKLLLFLLLVGVLVGIAVLKRKNLKLGDELRRVDYELKLATEKTQSLEKQLARYRTPREIEGRLAQWRCQMVHPVEACIRRLPDPAEGGAAADPLSRMRVLAQAQTPGTLARSP